MFYCLIPHTPVPPASQPASRRMTTTQHIPKNINQHTSETSYNALYRLHTSNEFILACKDSNSLDIIFDFSNPNSCHCPSCSGRQYISRFGGLHMGELIPRNLRPTTLPILFGSSQVKYAYPMVIVMIQNCHENDNDNNSKSNVINPQGSNTIILNFQV